MDIHSFFQLSLGRWFVQRTSYDFVTQDSAVRTGEQSLEVLEDSDPRILQTCNQAAIDPTLMQASFTVAWKEATLGKPPQPQQTDVLVLAAHGSQARAMRNGIVLRSNPLLLSKYILREDQSLLLTQTIEKRQSQERIWFASPNLRLRTTLVHVGAHCLLSSFCSEVRLGVQSKAVNAEVIRAN